MQLDAARMQRMSDKERKKLIAAGKCFGCKETGHLYRECPKQSECKGKEKQKTCPKPKLRTADTSASIEEIPSEEEEEEETSKEMDAPPAYSKKNLMAAIKKLSMEDRDDLLNTMALSSDQDF